MEILKPLSTPNPQIFSSLHSISNSITIYRNKTPLNFKTSFFKFNFPLHSSRNFRVSAHFDRPTKRRKNHLRRKLIQQQVINSTPENPLCKINDSLSNLGNFNNNIDSKLDSDKVSETSKSNNVLWNQLNSWANQYKADTEFWGIGSNPIFTVYQDSNGKVEKVEVNKDEILKRNRIYNLKEVDHVVENKISHANFLAKEMEIGKNVLPLNSTVAKYVNSHGKSGFLDTIQTFTSKPGFVPKVSKIGVAVFSGFLVFLALKGIFGKEKGNKKEYSSLEKEMLRRKIKARMAKEKSTQVSVEVIQDDKEPEKMVFTEKPQLDKEELMNNIVKIKAFNGNSMEFDDKIQEIQAMARHAREIEKKNGDISNGEDDESIKKEEPNDKEVKHVESPSSFDVPQSDISSENIGNSDVSRLESPNNGESKKAESNYVKSLSFDVPENDISRIIGSEEKDNIGNSDVSRLKFLSNKESTKDELNEKELKYIEPSSFDVLQSNTVSGLRSEEKGNIGNSGGFSRLEVPNNDESVVAQDQEVKRSNLLDTEKKPVEKKSRIIRSVKEAREYLQKRKVDKNQEAQVTDLLEASMAPKMNSKGQIFDFSGSSAPSRSKPSKDTDLGEKENGLNKNANDSTKNANGLSKNANGLTQNANGLTKNADGLSKNADSKEESNDAKTGELGRRNREKWMEDNFHEFEPIIEKIRGGFRDNYMVAREKVKEEDINIVSELSKVQADENESEFEWMKDEKLREIVFQVRENELMGRDPFYLMEAEDKALFFKGLEKKVEKVNEQLHALHEYVHSNIENLDYGADGISVYDPPEKIIPRWKGAPPATTMSQESLDDYLNQRKALFAETLGNSELVKMDPQNSSKNEKVKSSTTVIEGSDGSTKPGKKSGKEFWEHTKKWSQGFIESYNAESDPEIKAVMKDIGKDLDRWTTEKEIEEAANIMDKVPDKGKKLITERINKLKREMELFGPQAVVSKYREYGDEEEIDYYWWLDLPFVLCIELYINEDEGQRIGFYSLEMASDLELDPKPHHIIAFEDVGDCKNLCYIIQAQMEMLGNGTAFVVPQSPKDAYQEARVNGFNVTVIRKGELKLDVDQTLEEVEEKIEEIGSKMYHDKIMKGRDVNIDSLMKGVFGIQRRPTKRRRSRKILKKPVE